MSNIKTVTRTLRLKISLSEYSLGDKKEGWKRLRDINHHVWMAANEIINSQYFNDQVVFRLPNRLDFSKSELEDKFKEIFGVKRQATSERDIKTMFPDLPPCITNRLNSDVVACYRKDKKEIFKGLKSLRRYKKDLPMPVTQTSVDFSFDENKYKVIWSLSRDEKMTFTIFLGRDKGNYAHTLNKIINTNEKLEDIKKKFIGILKKVRFFNEDNLEDNKRLIDIGVSSKNVDSLICNIKEEFGTDVQYMQFNNQSTFKDLYSCILQKWRAPSFILKDKDLYLSLPVQDEVILNKLDDTKSIGVDLGIAIPLYCAVSDGYGRLAIGSKEEFLKQRTQIQHRKNRMQKNATNIKGGKGRRNKLKVLDRFKENEKNFVKTYNHMVSLRAVDFALKNNAGVIKLEHLKGIGQERKNKWILRNWSYFQLQTMIEYKAKRAGIKTVYINPAYTSQTCSKCGNLEKGQRVEQAKFICKKCGVELNADYNAALNISRSNDVVKHDSQPDAGLKAEVE